MTHNFAITQADIECISLSCRSNGEEHLTMATGLIQPIENQGTGWFSAAYEPTLPIPAAPPSSVAFNGLVAAAQKAAPPLRRLSVSPTVREPLPPQPDFARRVESELSFLRATARRWYRDRANIDDLVQDTVMQALANAHLWRTDQPESNLRGWLFTIMRNRFLAGMARSKRFDTALDAIAAADECVPAAPSRPEARLMMRDVERALLRLPKHQQTAIWLVGVEGRPYEEAARLMNMSVAAVRCHLSRGRERLHDMVEGRTASPVCSRSLRSFRPAPSHSGPGPSLLKQLEYA
jgi:RNA polymerase sigma factor (sigma-70 family)